MFINVVMKTIWVLLLLSCVAFTAIQMFQPEGFNNLKKDKTLGYNILTELQYCT